MFARANETMIPALKALWLECFGDAQEYVDFYFSHRFRPEEMTVWLEEGKPVSMLSLLPCEIMLGGAYQKASYVYAVATQVDKRRNGYGSVLMEYVNERLEKRGEPISLLVPASEDLSAFYVRRGYHDAFSLKSVELLSEQLAACNSTGYTFTTATPRVYKKMRDAFFEREGYVRWDESSIAYALEENEFHGGNAYKITSRYGQGVALCIKIKDRLFLRELTVPDEAVLDVCAALARRMRCTSALLRLPASSTLEGEVRAYGMANEAAPQFAGGGYFNLTLD